MKKLFCMLCVIVTVLCLCSCKDNSSQMPNEYEPWKTNSSKDHVSEFMELLGGQIELDSLLSGFVLEEEHCYNVTPTQVAEETDMKIFKFSDSCASFVTVDDAIYPLCDFLGGYGFVNALPCDFDKDGNKDLFVASSWGSGMRRSIISVFNSVTKESTVLYDTATTDTPDVDLVVAQSTANLFTDNPEIDEKLYYSVLSVKINVENNNFATLSYDIVDIAGHIEITDDGPVFKPYAR